MSIQRAVMECEVNVTKLYYLTTGQSSVTQTSYVDARHEDRFAQPCCRGWRQEHSPVEDVHSGLEFCTLSRPLTLLGFLHVLVLLTVAE